MILAIDTSLGPCSVAVLKGGEIVAEARDATPNSQSRVLVPMIESVLEKAGISYAGCDAVACTLGPGGFTGIRVGLATARAIALAAAKPLIGLTTLEVMAFAAGHRGDVLCVIDAYRGQRYVQRFRANGRLEAQSDPLLVDEKTVASLAHAAKIVGLPPRADDLARLAAEKWSRGEREFASEPLYIRAPDAKPPTSEALKCAEESL